MLEIIQQTTAKFAELAGSILALPLGGGLYFLIRSKFTPFRYIRHALISFAANMTTLHIRPYLSHSAFSSAMAGI